MKSKLKRILLFVHSFPPYSYGGTETYVYKIAEFLSEDYKVEVIFPTFNEKDKEIEKTYDKSFLTIKINIKDNYLSRFVFPERVYMRYKMTEKIMKEVRDFSPDIIHFHHLLGFPVKLPIYLHKYYPIVFTLHDYWFICPMVNMVDLEYKICNGPRKRKRCVDIVAKTLMEQPGERHKIIAYFLKKPMFYNNFRNLITLYYSLINWENRRNNELKYISWYIDNFISPSKFLKEKMVENGFPYGKIKILPHGFQYPGYIKKVKDEYINFGFVGTILPHKGLHVALDAFRNIYGKWKFHIFGRFEPNRIPYHKKLQEMAINIPNIQFYGFEKDKERIYSKIDILIIPSLWYENYPLTVREAFLYKIPVIASYIGALKEAFEDGNGGEFFKPGDSADLRKKIQYLVDNPQRIEKLKRRISKPMVMEEHLKRLIEIYNETMEIHHRI